MKQKDDGFTTARHLAAWWLIMLLFWALLLWTMAELK
jgi:hypothetical protein